MSNRSRAALVQVFLYDLSQTTLAYQMDGTKRTDDDDASTQQTIPMARTPVCCAAQIAIRTAEYREYRITPL